MQHAIKWAITSAYENFTSPHNRLAARFLVVALLGLMALSAGQIIGNAVAPIAIDGRR